jgi:hypothetical protein
MSAELLKLPWITLLALASGYVGYYIAHVGIKEHHKNIDVAFSTLVFGFVSAFFYETATRTWGWQILPASAAAFVFSGVIGGIWRRWLRDLTQIVLRIADVSHSDDLPNAWVALFTKTSFKSLQLTVKLKDGTWLKCDDLNEFEKRPNGPCVLGGAGDLLMYVTHQQNPDQEEFWACSDVVSREWGDEITYVPKDQIARVDIRRKR